MKKINIFLLLLGLFSPMVSSCSSQANTTFEILENNIQMQRYEEHAIETNFKNIDESLIQWKSSNANICTVKNGIITSLNTGRSTITCQYEDYQHSLQVLVLANTTGRVLSVDKSNIVLNIGQTATLNSTLKENGEVKQANIIYESSLPDIISVDENGLITGLKRGSAIVSVYTIYKGQEFTKDVKVQVVSLSYTTTEFTLEDNNHQNTTLEKVSNNTELGFDDNSQVYKYSSNGGIESRLFVKDAYTNNIANYERLAFNIKFETIGDNGISLYLAYGKNKVINASKDLITSSSTLLFYDYKGRIASYLRNSKVYTVVINLTKNGTGYDNENKTIYEYGFCFNDSTISYVSNPILCSEDYLYQNLEFEKPTELPTLNMKYAESGQGLDAGVEKLDYFDKYWIGYSSGTPGWDDSIWNDRVVIGGLSYSQYREYKYYQFDVVFTNTEFKSIMIWTGGYALSVDSKCNISSSEGIVMADDLYIYKDNQQVSANTQLLTDTVYTFKIRVQKDNLENVAFGFSINSTTKNPIYFANPTFTNL